MKDQFDKVINFGVGLFAFSKEKIEALVEDMVERGEVKKEEASQVVDDLVQKGEEQRNKMNVYIDEQIAEKTADFATKDDVRQIIREELKFAQEADKKDQQF